MLFRSGMAASYTSEKPEDFVFFAESGRAGALLEVLGGSEALATARIPAPLLEEEARARKAVDAGVDGLVVEGGEGGGFKNPRDVASMVLDVCTLK